MKKDTAVVNGIEMRYARFGTGKKNLLIIAGISLTDVVDSAPSVARMYRRFTNDYTVYLFGRRSNPPGRYSLKEMANDLKTVLDFLGIAQADITGVSQGGMIAMILASLYPESVGRLILTSTSACRNEASDRIMRQWVRLSESTDNEALVRSMIEGIYAPNTIEKYGEMFVEMNRNLTAQERKLFEIIATSLLDFDLRSYLPSIQAKTLVVGCKGDRALGVEPSVYLAEALSAKLVVFGEEYGHAVYDEAPDYLDCVFDFLHEENDAP
ncbi:MAG TPA: hypothetical protein DDY98_05120 [Ruminococcaceae bacterium]|nr:hypothetical protein [Oscillospiraceae bacterium]